jgi:hypothetical protein
MSDDERDFRVMKIEAVTLIQITRRPSGDGLPRSSVVSANEAERLALAERVDFHWSLLELVPSSAAAVR